MTPTSGRSRGHRRYSAESDQDLFALTHDGESGAESELLRRHTGLAAHIARKYAGRGEATDELVHIARIGLCQAIRRFDPERGVKFSSFAVPLILGEIRNHFRTASRTVRLPRSVTDMARDARIAREHLESSLGRTPTPAEIAEDMGAAEDAVLEALDAVRSSKPLDGITTASLRQEDAETALIENKDELERAVASMTPAQKRVLSLRFEEEKSQQQIADELGLSQMQVSRVLGQSLRLLRNQLSDQ